MSTYREIVYLILDELRLVSDDSDFTEDHIIFLMDKYRSLILKKYYSTIKKEIPESNYQVLCLSLSQVTDDFCGGDPMLVSTTSIPDKMEIGQFIATPYNPLYGTITMIPYERMQFVGSNKYLQNVIYGCINIDNKVYLKSCNPNFLYIEKIKIRGLFENASKASKYICATDNTVCNDYMDITFPLEEALIPELVEYIVKEVSGALYKLTDNINNSHDDTAEIASAIQAAAAKKKASTSTT